MPHARTTDPQTSHDAARSVTNIRALKQVITELLNTPMTDPELLLRIRYRYSMLVTESGVRSRRSELVKAGQVKDTGARKQTSSGRLAIVWGRA